MYDPVIRAATYLVFVACPIVAVKSHHPRGLDATQLTWAGQVTGIRSHKRSRSDRVGTLA